MDGGAWWATVHGVAKSRTQLSDFTFTLGFSAVYAFQGHFLDCDALFVEGFLSLFLRTE